MPPMKMTAAKTLLLGVPFALGCGTALAGSDNKIEIIQTNTLGIGNSLTADQSLATGSLIQGASLSGNELVLSSPAEQTGGNNTADLSISDSANGVGGRIGLTQKNSSSLLGGNHAIVAVDGNGLGLVRQIGDGNLANLSVTGRDASGSIFQNGDKNSVGSLTAPGLSVSGTGAHGSITLNGSNNNVGLSVTGAGTSVSYTLNGSNVTAMMPNATASTTQGDFQVYSNSGAAITITQTTLP
jgi:hypothetical protein